MHFLESLYSDFRHALRILRKSPGFTSLAMLTLALGVGANTAIFTLVNALMLRTLPVRDPGQVVELLHSFPNEPAFNGFSGEAYRLLRDGNHAFTGLIASTYQTFTVRTDSAGSLTVTGGYVDGSFFSVLGLSPAIGRLLGPLDDQVAHPSSVAVVSWSYWKNKLNFDPGILGKQIFVENVPVTIVGVTPRAFSGLSQQANQDLWLPLSVQPVLSRSVLGWGALILVGRLKPGVSFEQARAEMTVLFYSTMQAPNNNPFLRQMKFDMRPAATGLTSPLLQQFRTPLLVLMAIVSLLLLLACTNVASLLLVRGAARQHEMGVRICLGAGRSRIVRQVLTESLVLSAIGTLFGVGIARFGANALIRILTSGRDLIGVPANFAFRVDPDLHVLFFTTGVALLTALLFGIAPAMRALATEPLSALRQSGQTGKPAFRRLFGKGLVATQVALSLILLSAAALFIGYLSNLQHLDLGFQPDHLLLVSLDPSQSGLEPARFLQQAHLLLEELEAIPGVRSATVSSMTPVSGSGQACYCLNVEGHKEEIGDLHILTFINRIGPNYFKTYATPLLAGREFSARDQADSRVAIVNQAMARGYFGDLNPIGKHFTFDRDNGPYEIVGVVGDARYNEIREDERRTVYLNYYLNPFHVEQVSSQLTLRTSLDPEAVAPEVRRMVKSTLKTVSVARITTMDDQVEASIVPERLIATLSGWFGALGALFAAISIYGLLTYTVARRTNEIGIRMALGAARSDVMRMILRDAFAVVCAGLLVGAPAAFGGKRIALSLIHDLPAKNSLSVVLGALAMLAIAALAAYFPARRATRVDPMVALRYE